MRLARRTMLLGVAASLVSCATVPRTLEAPTVRMVGLSLLEATASRQRFRVSLLLENPNAMAIPVRALDFDVRLAGEGLLTGRSMAPFTLPSLGTETVHVEVASDLVSSVSRLLALVRGPDDALRYEISGELALERRGVRPLPFRYAGEVPLTATLGILGGGL